MSDQQSGVRQLQGMSRTPGSRLVFECEAEVLPGLEALAYDEINERFGRLVEFTDTRREGALRFLFAGDLWALLELRGVVTIYLVQHFAVPRPRALLGHQHFEALIQTIQQARRLFPFTAYRTIRLSAAGEDSSVLTRLKEELAQRTGLEAVADDADLLVRLRRAPLDEGWEALVRISPRPLSTRSWRVCNMPGAPNATLAWGMLRLTKPSPEDRVLNVACGSGTLLIERLAQERVWQAVGCDIDWQAIECAQANLMAATYDPMVQLECWDARAMPVEDASFTVICSDLPFGQLVGSHEENRTLYPQIVREAARVAATGARMVLLTHEVRLLEGVAAEYEHLWQVEQIVPVRSGGMTPRIFLFVRSQVGV